jgi:hypothetical protein
MCSYVPSVGTFCEYFLLLSGIVLLSLNTYQFGQLLWLETWRADERHALKLLTKCDSEPERFAQPAFKAFYPLTEYRLHHKTIVCLILNPYSPPWFAQTRELLSPLFSDQSA